MMYPPVGPNLRSRSNGEDHPARQRGAEAFTSRAAQAFVSGTARNLDAPTPVLPGHIEETIRATVRLYADHHRAATRVQVVVQRMVDLLGRPGFIGLMITAVLCWTGGNLLALAFGYTPIDPASFSWLELAVTLTALCITALIPTTQRRDDQLAEHREQMSLELALLSEQKLAKVIQLLEESRRDNPLLSNRVDASADAMAMPADPPSLGHTFKRSYTDITQIIRQVSPAIP
jgi:uncharacterized membrane protein